MLASFFSKILFLLVFASIGNATDKVSTLLSTTAQPFMISCYGEIRENSKTVWYINSQEPFQLDLSGNNTKYIALTNLIDLQVRKYGSETIQLSYKQGNYKGTIETHTRDLEMGSGTSRGIDNVSLKANIPSRLYQVLTDQGWENRKLPPAYVSLNCKKI